jgi:hypothetical protein
MKVIFEEPTEDGFQDVLTVTVSGDPEDVTLEFSNEVGNQEPLKNSLLTDKAFYARLETKLPDSDGMFNAKKLEHWRNIRCICHSQYLDSRIEE